MEDSQKISFLQRHKLLLTIILLLMVILFMLSRYSFLVVEVTSGGPNAEYTYGISDHSGRTTELRTKEPSIKKIMPRGSYEIIVKQNDKSSFSVVKTTGFFTTTKVGTELKAEKSRQFVGNNPSVCMHYLKTLYSYDCGGQFHEIIAHVPATANLPTHTIKQLGTDIHGFVEDIIKIKGGVSLALIHFNEPGASNPRHVIYHLNNRMQIVSKATLMDLDGDQTYSIKPFREGFIIYDDPFNSVFYYSAIGSPSQKITLPAPGDTELQPISLSVRGSSLLATYSTTGKGEINDTDEDTNTDKELIWQDASRSRHFRFSGQESSFILCGSSRLCLLDAGSLKVYDIAGEKPKFQFAVDGVKFIENVGDNLLAVRDKEVLALDIDKGGGFIDYSFGDYRYCGLQPDINRYLLCLINGQNDKVALLIDRGADNIDSIDKKIQALQKQPEVSDVSIYGKYITVSPNLGSPAYIPSLNNYAYSPEVINSVNAKIAAKIKELGIDRESYIITSITE